MEPPFWFVTLPLRATPAELELGPPEIVPALMTVPTPPEITTPSNVPEIDPPFWFVTLPPAARITPPLRRLSRVPAPASLMPSPVGRAAPHNVLQDIAVCAARRGITRAAVMKERLAQPSSKDQIAAQPAGRSDSPGG